MLFGRLPFEDFRRSRDIKMTKRNALLMILLLVVLGGLFAFSLHFVVTGDHIGDNQKAKRLAGEFYVHSVEDAANDLKKTWEIYDTVFESMKIVNGAFLNLGSVSLAEVNVELDIIQKGIDELDVFSKNLDLPPPLGSEHRDLQLIYERNYDLFVKSVADLNVQLSNIRSVPLVGIDSYVRERSILHNELQHALERAERT